MLVTMIQTKPMSIDGINVLLYHAGNNYDLPNDSAALAVAAGWAKYVDPPTTTEREGNPAVASAETIEKPLPAAKRQTKRRSKQAQ